MWNENDLEEINFEKILKGLSDVVYDNYWKKFIEKRKAAEENNDESKKNIFKTLELASSFHFNPESVEEPFAPMIVTQAGRSAIPDDFHDEQLELIDQIIKKINDPDLKARLADLLWIRKKEYLFVSIAVESYIEAANALIGREKQFIQ